MAAVINNLVKNTLKMIKVFGRPGTPVARKMQTMPAEAKFAEIIFLQDRPFLTDYLPILSDV